MPAKKSSSQFDLTIIIPALNEEKRIGKTLDELARFVKSDKTLKSLSIEVIVVSANSIDKTHEVALGKKKKFAHFRFLKPGPRVGKGRDVKYAMLRAKGNAVTFMDADLATPLRHLPTFYRAFLRGNEVVIGTRNLRKHHPEFLRRLVSNIGNLLFRIAGGVWVEDSQCGFKLFSKHAAKLCFSKLTVMGWVFDMEVLAIAKANKLKIKSYRINDWVSVPGGTFTESMVKNTLVTLNELSRILFNRLLGKYKEQSATAAKAKVAKDKPKRNKSFWIKLALFAGVPILLYAVLFYVFQPHYLTEFSSKFYLDNGDGFQNVWNIWWVNHSLGEHASNPYFTTMLHAPHGVSLFPQTMNIINGIVAIPLINLLGFSLIEVTNFAVLSAFVFGGLTMFWFIYKLVKSYPVALVAGGLFTFSSFHFAHAQGHLQLVTLQFIPLFLLAFWTLLEKMKYTYAVLAAVALFLVLLSDYYYLFWSVMLGAMWFGWKLYKKELKINKKTVKVLGVFAALSLTLIGPLVFALVRLNNRDPLTGSHDPTQFALDPLSIIIPGGSWYWRSLTDWHWQKLPYLAEMSLFFGFGLLIVLATVFYKSFWRKKQFKAPSWLNFWWIVLFVFGILSLGPRPTTFGKTLHDVPLPYALLERVFPTLKISGMPVRWVLIVLLASIVIVSYALSRLNLRTRTGLALFVVFVAVSLIDLWPGRLPLTIPATRPYVQAVKKLEPGILIDNGALSGAEQLYHQTVHSQPMAFGYVTRTPQSVDTKDFLIFAALEENRYDELCRIYKIRYVTLPVARPLTTSFPVIYNDNDTLIYDLKNSPNC